MRLSVWLMIFKIFWWFKVTTSLPQSATFSNFHDDNVVTSASTSLYQGESVDCVITIKNVSQVPVEILDVEVSSMLDPYLQEQMFQWNDEDVKLLLPIEPGESKMLTLHLFSAGTFLVPNVAVSPTIPHEMSSGLYSSMSTSLPGLYFKYPVSSILWNK